MSAAAGDGTRTRRPWRLAARVLAVQAVTLAILWILQATFGG